MLNNIRVYQLFIGHIGLLILIYLLLYIVGVIQFFPTNKLLIQWDASWYNNIVENGYIFKENEQSNTGFFPFFPLIWKAINLPAIGISVFNYLLFLIGIKLITNSLSFVYNNLKVLFSLGFPSLLFMYTPYSEALFFCAASLYLYGNYKSNIPIKIIALLLSSFARPTIFFFLPAVIFSEFTAKESVSNKVKNIILLSSIIFIGTFISFWIVGLNSDNLFAYSDSQINNWSHNFSIPKFPLTTWRGYRILWLDFIGLWVSICAVIGSVYYFFLFLKSKLNVPKNLLLSLSYISMILIYVLFFHPKEESTGLTTILSHHRYVLCSPFLFYIFYYYSNNLIANFKLVIGIGALISLFIIGIPFTTVNGLDYLATLAFGGIVLVYCISLIIPLVTTKKYLILGIYIINCGLQIYLFQSFLKGNWIG